MTIGMESWMTMNDRNRRRDTFRAMGTTIETDIIFSSRSEEAVDVAFQNVRETLFRLERIFSRFLKESEFSKLNASLGKECLVSREMFDVLTLSVRFSKETDGVFDPRILPQLLHSGYAGDFYKQPPNATTGEGADARVLTQCFSEEIFLDARAGTVQLQQPIDLGGIAKGYAVQVAVKLLRDQGYTDFVVDAGGDMFTAGHDEEDDPWLVAIEGIDESDARWRLSDAAVATSGVTRRSWNIGNQSFHHLVNPRNPKQYDFSLQSVSVVSDSIVEADVLAKTYFLLGIPEGLQRANELNHAVLFRDRNNHITQSDACAEFLD